MNVSLSRMPWHGQVGAFVVLSLAAVGVFWNWYASPARASIGQRRQQLAVLRAEIDRGLTTARRLPEFRNEVAQLEGQLERLRAVLPEEPDVADLLRRVQAMAAQSNLTMRGFTPQATATRGMHVEWPIGLQLEGSYHDLGGFLDRISKSPRIINVNGLRVRAREGQPGPATVTVECAATTFVLLTRPAGPPAAQTPAAPAAAPPPAASAGQPQGFAYNAEGRRDPFVRLLRRGGGGAPQSGQRPAGLAGLLTSEVTLRGLIQGQSGFVGMLLGADQRTYIVRPGDKLFDGVVQSITPAGLVIRQEANDPLSPDEQRDVRKPLRQADEAQQ